jgi:hypothetical protein
MDADLKPGCNGENLGIDAANRVHELAEEYSKCERQRIELVNQPRAHGLVVEMSIDAALVTGLEERLRLAEPPGDRRARRRKALYYWGVASLLTVASFFFSVIAFDPFRLAWKGWLYCLGVAIVTPFCFDQFLEAWESHRLTKAITTLAAISALTSLLFLAVIRGSVLGQQIQVVAPAVEIDNDTASQPPAQDTFYAETVGLLRFTMGLLAIAMELGAGLALHRARRLGPGSGEDYDLLSAQLRQAQQRMTNSLMESEALGNEPAIFEATFWRNFYRAMLTHTLRYGLKKLLLLALFVPFVCHAQTPQVEHLNLVIALDLSASVSAQGHDGKTEFQKDVAAIGQLLSRMPAGSRVTVVGITENSFAQPYILLSAKVADDKGYFGERLTAARQQLLRTWQQRSSHLEPRAPQTDILGGLIVVGQLLEEASGGSRRILVLYSDMRHFTRRINLERPGDTTPDQNLARAELVADLKGVEVYALGVDAAGIDAAQWDRVREFWDSYFKRVRATLKNYSLFREGPPLELPDTSHGIDIRK